MQSFDNLLKSIQDVKVIDSSIDYSDYIPLNLSIMNVGLSQLELDSAIEFEKYINNYLKSNNGHIAYGGYNEKRNLYKRSNVFNDKGSAERNIHIGLDLWIKAGTIVLAALDGTVHSFKYNAGLGDYGPTIILKHQIDSYTFYTLYGHLSRESISLLKVGDIFKKGEKLATLGNAVINGDYSPHLHFQIIKNIGDNFGDYPGVCSKNDLAFYLENCPDPNLLLKIN